MIVNIKEAKTEQEAKIANNLLTKLVNYESELDRNIRKDFIVKDFYEKKLDEKNCIAIAYNEKREAIGFLYGYIQKYNAKYNAIGFIDAIYIEETYRNNDIATNLLSYFKEWTKTKGGKEIELNVLNNNDIAFEAYKKLGFNITKYTMSQKI